jgi:hypothetical protein
MKPDPLSACFAGTSPPEERQAFSASDALKACHKCLFRVWEASILLGYIVKCLPEKRKTGNRLRFFIREASIFTSKKGKRLPAMFL